MELDTREKLQGIFAPIATPFKDNEDLDTDASDTQPDALRKHVRCEGASCWGPTVRARVWTTLRRQTVLEAVLGNVSERLTMTVGVMYEAYRHAEQFIRRSADLGADFALVQSPSYFKKLMTDDALCTPISPALPIALQSRLLIYHCPGFNGITLSFDLAGEAVRTPQHCGNEGQYARM